jgi:hypothetical protein
MDDPVDDRGVIESESPRSPSIMNESCVVVKGKRQTKTGMPYVQDRQEAEKQRPVDDPRVAQFRL